MDMDDIIKHVTKCSDIDPDSLKASDSSKISSHQCSCCENSSLSSTKCSHSSCYSETSYENQAYLSSTLEDSPRNVKNGFIENISNLSSLEALPEFDTAFASYIERENDLKNPYLIKHDDQDGLLLFPDTEISSEQSELTLGTSNSAVSILSEENSPPLLNNLEFEDIDGGLTSFKLVQQENNLIEESRPHSNMDFYYINDICNDCQILSPGMYIIFKLSLGTYFHNIQTLSKDG